MKTEQCYLNYDHIGPCKERSLVVKLLYDALVDMGIPNNDILLRLSYIKIRLFLYRQANTRCNCLL